MSARSPVSARTRKCLDDAVGDLIGIHWSLALSAMVLLAVVAMLSAFALRPAAVK